MPRKTQKPSARARKAEPEPQASPLAEMLGRAISASGAAIGRNPMAVGGSTAFLVALFFVSANAMWYQPHFHANAFFSTRQQPQNALPFEQELNEAEESTSDLQTQSTAPMPGDPVVEQVQTVLADLKLYRGAVDGRMGKETSEAIATYQKILGQPTTGRVDDALLNHLRIQTSTASIGTTAPAPSDPHPAGRPSGGDEVAALISGGSTGSTAAAAGPDKDRVSRIQAGLRAFGNESVDVDGLMGAKTRNAIREFQSLFGLQQTGEPDDELYAKMREIGLTE
jgi:peptidoglycan hydrolase-like protein with peptidoglycan-binding domain